MFSGGIGRVKNQVQKANKAKSRMIIVAFCPVFIVNYFYTPQKSVF